MVRWCVITLLALTLTTMQTGSPSAAQNTPAQPTPETISDLRGRLTAIEHDLQSLKDIDQGANADLRSRLTAVEHDFQALKDRNQQAIDTAKDGTQKDLSKLNEQIENLNRRIGDVHNSVGDLNLTLLGLAAFLTVIGLVGGVGAYVSAGHRAREAAEKWMNDHSAVLDTGIRARVDQIVADASGRIEAIVGETERRGAEATARMQAAFAAGQTPDPSVDERQALRETDEALRGKAEREYTVEDWTRRAFAAYADKRLEIAAEYFGEAARVSSATPSQQAQSLFNRAMVLDELGRFDDALLAYRDIAERFNNSTDSVVREQLAKSLVNRGFRLAALKRYEEAITDYNRVLEIANNTTDLALLQQVGKASSNKGIALGHLERREDEQAAYDALIALLGAHTETVLREQVAIAIFNKGVAYGLAGRHDEEIAAYDSLLARFADAPELELSRQVAETLINKGVALARLGQQEPALTLFDTLIERFRTNNDIELRKQVAINNKGHVMKNLHRNDDAVTAFEEVITRYENSTEDVLKNQVERARTARAELQHA